jgi:HD-like signal output (HDOD) protein
MGTIHISRLEPGMVLEDEVRDLNGRLLLGKGKTVQPKHFRRFKTWGVTEINIRGNNEDKNVSKPGFDPEQYEKIIEFIRQRMRYNDLEHPAIKEIFRLSVWFRNEYKFYDDAAVVLLAAGDQAELANEKKCVKKIAYANLKLPEIPSVVYELNDVISNPLSSSDDIAQIVQKSPSLTSILLKIANSPIYGFPSKIDKISLAVTLIGTREISSLGLGLSVLSTFDKIPRELVDMFSFLKHSIACGIISRMLASNIGIAQTEQYFVTGLVHDLGRLIIFCNFPEDSRNILHLSQTTHKLLYELEEDYFGCNHSHVARLLIKKWKLPVSLENNVFHHHNPAEAPQPVAATLLHLADIITNSLGIGTSGERFVPPLDTKAWDALGLPITCFDKVIKQATHQFFALEAMLEN